MIDVSRLYKENINKHLNSVNGAKGALGLSQATFYGLNADGKADLNAANNANISLSTPTYSAETPDTKKLGVHTKISGGASLTAEGNVNVPIISFTNRYTKPGTADVEATKYYNGEMNEYLYYTNSSYPTNTFIYLDVITFNKYYYSIII